MRKLFTLVKNGNYWFADELLKAGSVPTKDGKCALNYELEPAIKNDDPDMVGLLIKNGATTMDKECKIDYVAMAKQLGYNDVVKVLNGAERK